jgi:hypothetical protein
MIFREDFGCKYEASNGRTRERKGRTHCVGSAAGTRSDARAELRQHAFRSLYLTDVTEAKLYAGTLLDCWRFELRPGETKSHVFQVGRPDASLIAAVVGTHMIAKTLKAGPARYRHLIL